MSSEDTRQAIVKVAEAGSNRALAASGEWSVRDLVAQVAKIQEAMKAVMRVDEHFGTIPGTPKPTLYKPGAEKLCLLFRLDPQFDCREIRDGNHLTVISTCTLYSLTTGQRMGSGMGSCSTKEAKYGYRDQSRKCPSCGKPAIIKGKAEYGGGFVCFKKKDGCGAKFGDNDKAILDQPTGRIENPDLPDMWNTVIKMSNKRALIAAVLVVTGASDIFTQDLEDLTEVQSHFEPAKPMPQTKAPSRPTVEQPVMDVEGYSEAAPESGMPAELREIITLIDSARDMKDLGFAAAEAGKLEPSLLAEARKAWAAKKDEITGGKK